MSSTVSDLPAPSASKPGTAPSWNAIVRSLKRRIARIREAYRLQRDVRSLSALDDHMLADIGLARSDLVHVARHGRRSTHGDC